ncbi:hypothetical protein L596_026260 [Steinernema carpocapsae]|uniref:Uncharacterized protein n=1 Tax=Steinernema carpocapsae TaxID=34508 RepID=A0A4V5ZY51_STECR|nr:hypothetical protein L596_026260 [Steinernema carpocapsae]
MKAAALLFIFVFLPTLNFAVLEGNGVYVPKGGYGGVGLHEDLRMQEYDARKERRALKRMKRRAPIMVTRNPTSFALT